VFDIQSYSAIAYISTRSVLSADGLLDDIILFSTTSMATFSVYLMVVLFAVIQLPCNYCFLSAFLSISMATIAWKSKIVSNRTKAFSISATSALMTSVLSVFLFYSTISSLPATASTAPAAQIIANENNSNSKNTQKETKSPPPITTQSSARAIALAERLRALDAKMYGAFWCSHCHHQKEELGASAFARVQYIECDRQGSDSQFPLCRQKNVPGYPTWEIDGKFYPGEKSIEEIEKLLPK
jgi:hypothetical protein